MVVRVDTSFRHQRFTILAELGSGGMGTVYRAFDRERNIELALKLLRDVEPAGIARFKQEFRSLADLVHPNLVQLYELVSAADEWFFTMALIEGATFLDAVRGAEVDRSSSGSSQLSSSATSPPWETTFRSPTPTGAADATLVSGRDGLESGSAGRVTIFPPMTEPQRFEKLREAAIQLAEGVLALHESGQLHRDIKPPNIMVEAGGRVVLLDFGVATALADQSTSKQVIGTPAYMAPEQCAGAELQEASDWYSFGVVLYEAMTGTRPFVGASNFVLSTKQRFDAPPLSERAPRAPDDLATLCMELVARDPGARPTGEQVLARLQRGAGAPRKRLDRAAKQLVGRSRELATLDGALADVRGGQARMVHVVGTSGMGKTMLLRHFLSLAKRQGALVLKGRCYESESVPYKALDSLMDALVRHLLRVSDDVLLELLPEHAASLARLFPAFNQLSPLRTRFAEESIDPHEHRRRAFGALRKLLRELCRRAPLVLYIDDVQWGDRDSAPLIANLVDAVDPVPVLWLLSFRADEIETSPFLRDFLPQQADAVKITVGPLSFEQSKDMAVSLLGADSDADHQQAEVIARESEGSPMFVVELARYVVSGGDLVAKLLGLDEVLAERIAKLPPRAQEFLQVVALAGRPTSQRMIWRCTRDNRADPDALALLRNGRLARTRGHRMHHLVEAYHDRVRETAVAMLNDTQREQLHERLAVAIEESKNPRAESLVEHWLGANKPQRAGRYAALAAEQATEALAFDRAAYLYGLALAQAAPGPRKRFAWTVARAQSLANAGYGQDAATAYQQASELSPSEQALDLRMQAAAQMLRSGNLAEGRKSLRAVFIDVGLPWPTSRRRALLSLVWARARLFFRGLGYRHKAARDIAPASLALVDVYQAAADALGFVDAVMGANFQTHYLLAALKTGEPVRLARALGSEAVFQIVGGSPKRATKLMAMAKTISDSVDDARARANHKLVAGLVSYCGYNWQLAYDESLRAEEIFRAHCKDVFWEISMAQFIRLSALGSMGELGQLRSELPEAVRDARERGDINALTQLGSRIVPWAALAAAREKEGLDELGECMTRLLYKDGFNHPHLSALWSKSELEMGLGDGKRAYRTIVDAWPQIKKSMLLSSKLWRIYTNYLRGSAAMAALFQIPTDDPDRNMYWRDVRRCVKRLARDREHWALAFANSLRAGLAQLGGDTVQAIQLLEEAEVDYTRADLRRHVAAARFHRGTLMGGQEGDALVAEVVEWMGHHGFASPPSAASVISMGTPHLSRIEGRNRAIPKRKFD